MKRPKLIRITTVPISLKILLKGQLGFMRQYFDVVAVSSRGKELDEVEAREGVRTVALDMSREITPLKDFISLIKMCILLWREKPDIVHTHTPKAGLIGMMAAWITRVPHRLHTVAGLPLMESRGIKRNILMLVEKLTYTCATHVYPNSFGLETFIINKHLCDTNKLKVLGNGSSNGIDTDYFRLTDGIEKQKALLRQKLEIQEDDFIFVFVGRIVKDKGIDELLKAFEQLNREIPCTKLMLVGAFEEKLDPVSDHSRSILKDNPAVISAGFQQDVRPFLALADCFVFPSYREGFPNVVMQAGAMGLPSIVSDINGCNEIVKTEKNGMIIPLKNTDALYMSMKEMYQNRPLRETLSENARAMIVERYDQKIMWQTIKQEYDNLLKERQ